VLDVYTLALAGLAALVAWRLFRSRRPTFAPADEQTPWRLVPLAAGATVLASAIIGAGPLLAPLAFLLTIAAAGRLGKSRGRAFLLGAMLNVWLTSAFAIAVGLVVYDLAA